MQMEDMSIADTLATSLQPGMPATRAAGFVSDVPRKGGLTRGVQGTGSPVAGNVAGGRAACGQQSFEWNLRCKISSGLEHDKGACNTKLVGMA